MRSSEHSRIWRARESEDVDRTGLGRAKGTKMHQSCI